MTEKNFYTAHQRFAQTYEALFDLLETYPADKREQPGACGVWSARQVLAHLAGWLEEALTQYDRVLSGGETTFEHDLDGFNDQSVQARADLDWAATVADLKASHARFVHKSRTLDDSLANSGPVFTGWQLGLARDCKFHTGQLIAFAAASSSES